MEEGRLLDLDMVLQYLRKRGLEQIVPEVVDGNYPSPDYIHVPSMVVMAQEIKEKISK